MKKNIFSKNNKISKKSVISAINIIAVVLLMVLFTLFVFVPNEEATSFYGQYFRSMSSAKGFSKAESIYNLDDKARIDRVDTVNGVFIYAKDFLSSDYVGGAVELFALGDKKGTFTEYVYTNVLSIKGDYAIVTKGIYDTNELGETKLLDRIGVIKFKNTSTGSVVELTNFNQFGVVYDQTYQQVVFLGEDYIWTAGLEFLPTDDFNFSTIYRYKEKEQLYEVCKISGIDYEYNVAMYDDYIVAIGNKTGYAFYYDINNIDSVTGRLNYLQYDVFKGFSDDVDNQFKDYVEIYSNYLGNGWFTRTSIVKTQDKPEEGTTWCNIAFQEANPETGESTTYYGMIRSDIYNVKTKATKDFGWLYVNSVINEYNANAYKELINGLNNNIFEDQLVKDKYEYQLPFLNPANFIKKGYSLIYFYYFPYTDNPYFYEISFVIMDDNGNIIKLSDVLMPPLFIEGVGVESTDPIFESVKGASDLKYVTKNNDKIVLEEYIKGINSYEAISANDGVIIAREIRAGEDENNPDAKGTILYGAVDKDGTHIAPFDYRELTLFIGGYAIGTKLKKVGDDKFESQYFRISKNGEIVQLDKNIISIRQGVYIAETNKKIGLYNYAGDVLIPAEFDNIDVFETICDGDNYISSLAIAEKNGKTYLYELS